MTEKNKVEMAEDRDRKAPMTDKWSLSNVGKTRGTWVEESWCSIGSCCFQPRPYPPIDTTGARRGEAAAEVKRANSWRGMKTVEGVVS